MYQSPHRNFSPPIIIIIMVMAVAAGQTGRAIGGCRAVSPAPKTAVAGRLIRRQSQPLGGRQGEPITIFIMVGPLFCR